LTKIEKKLYAHKVGTLIFLMIAYGLKMGVKDIRNGGYKCSLT